MRIEYLEYLLEVAHTNSISAAAKKLFIGQTTLSAVINSIEKELNVRIFLRTHTGIKLTEQGERVIVVAEDIVEKNRQLLTLFTEVKPLTQKVAMVAYPGACSVLALYLTLKLQKENPDISLHMLEKVSTKIVSSVVAGDANLGIGSSARYEFFNSQYVAHNNGFLFEPLYEDHFCLCVNRKSKFAECAQVDVSELGEECLAVTESHSVSSVSSVGCIFKHVRQFSVFSNSEVVKRAVLFNDMISVMPGLSYYEDPNIAFGDLHLIPITGFESQLTNFLVINQKIGLNPLEELVVKLIREFYAALEKSPLHNLIVADNNLSVQ